MVPPRRSCNPWSVFLAEREDIPATLPAGTVDNLLRLAAVRVSEEEKPRLERELGRIIELIDALRGVDTTDVAPLAHPLETPHLQDAPQPLRTDGVTETVDRERLQQGAPAVRDGLYLVPRVVD